MEESSSKRHNARAAAPFACASSTFPSRQATHARLACAVPLCSGLGIAVATSRASKLLRRVSSTCPRFRYKMDCPIKHHNFTITLPVCSALDREIEHAHNVRMREERQDLCFSYKLLGILVGELCAQNLHCPMAVEMDMLAQIDVGESSSSQQAKQAIIAKLLAFMSDAVSHSTLLLSCTQMGPVGTVPWKDATHVSCH